MTGHNNPWYPLGKKKYIMSSIQEIFFYLKEKETQQDQLAAEI